MARSIGIDLGTTNSVVGTSSRGRPTVIPNAVTNLDWTPSLVGIDPGGSVLVGLDVDSLLAEGGSLAAHSMKRLMGRKIDDLAVRQMIDDDNHFFHFDIVEHPDRNGEIGIVLRDRILTPAEVSAEVLRSMRQQASGFLLGEAVAHAVITVPAYFRDPAIAATREAGRLAGLQVKHVMPEPTAAALAYGLDVLSGNQPRYVVVYDFGGGTFDVSVLLAVPNAPLQVLEVDGDNFLGGDDIDREISTKWHQALARDYGVSLTEGRGLGPSDLEKRDGLQWKLKVAARTAKEALAASPSRATTLPGFFHRDDGTLISPTWNLTRDELSSIAAPYIDRTFVVLERALDTANLARKDIGAVVVVGGSTKLHGVLDRLRWEFPDAEILNSINPMTVVGIGATVQTRMQLPWTCPACGRDNELSADACVGCGTAAISEQHECELCGALYAVSDDICPNPLCATRIVHPVVATEALSHSLLVQTKDGWYPLVARGTPVDPASRQASQPSEWHELFVARAGQAIELPIGQETDHDSTAEPEAVVVFHAIGVPADLQAGDLVRVRLGLNGSRLVTAEVEVRGQPYETQANRADLGDEPPLEAPAHEAEPEERYRTNWVRFLASGAGAVPDYSSTSETAQIGGAIKEASDVAREMADTVEAAAARGDFAAADEAMAELDNYANETLGISGSIAIATAMMSMTEDMDARRDLATALRGLEAAFASGDGDDVGNALHVLRVTMDSVGLPGNAGPEGSESNLLRKFRDAT